MIHNNIVQSVLAVLEYMDAVGCDRRRDVVDAASTDCARARTRGGGGDGGGAATDDAALDEEAAMAAMMGLPQGFGSSKKS